ncbi:TIGR03750 family conjugal transfer protein [Nocardioides sp. Kera G14]|uniref:TIGR03750 family conjugal transfer protein n=1 Tax=Nocardioides sp. Kera G14 TaxID=2884264 RepID=UPI001D0F7F5B|nr:TIGR03750 family conjugal transfer protein [Nocardioides sp. Kera G14]UDY23196.1 TIGR03750 family conjugal transfer protein [Nocardioides sp. Kera G14]
MGEFFSDINWVHFWSVPIFTAVIGWLINWTGLWMLFQPIHLHGFRIKGLKELAGSLPYKIQEIPGILHGTLGWQGIVPARAAKMGSIAVDRALSQMASAKDFYDHLEPEVIAAHIVDVFTPEVPALVEEIMWREHPRLWKDLPRGVRATIIERVQGQLPTIVKRVTDEIGDHIEQILDPKVMVIDNFERHPEIVVRIFKDFGARELRMMIIFGFIFGFVLGIPVAFVDQLFGQWWLLPLMGIVVGWATNKLGMWLIFEPADPWKIGPFKIQALFARRQWEASDVYGKHIAMDVITLERIGDHLLNGPSGDRTRQMLAEALAPAIEKAIGPASGAVRVAVGARRFDAIRTSVAETAVDYTLTPFKDAAFSEAQSHKIRSLIAERCRQLPAPVFVEMMRAAIIEDEWLLYAHGAIMGFVGGLVHLWIFGVG